MLGEQVEQPAPGTGFDDARLEDPAVLSRHDQRLRALAESGARVRREAAAAADVLPAVQADRPRAVVVAGAEARLLRAVLEPWCPVPFVAWPAAGLPGWAGPLDLVAVLAPAGGDEEVDATVAEALRRGARLVVAAPQDSALAEVADRRGTIVLPSQTQDGLAAVVVMLAVLHAVGLGPQVDAEEVAAALDEVAGRCAPGRDLAENPAKAAALVLADALPLVWGGSVLAARAARRLAEAMRRGTGRAALAADARHLLPVLDRVEPRDVFADPFDTGPTEPARPALVVLDDGAQEPAIRVQRSRLLAAAERGDVRVHQIQHDTGSELARYASLLAEGWWAADYLGIGLGTLPADPPA